MSRVPACTEFLRTSVGKPLHSWRRWFEGSNVGYGSYRGSLDVRTTLMKQQSLLLFQLHREIETGYHLEPLKYSFGKANTNSVFPARGWISGLRRPASEALTC